MVILAIIMSRENIEENIRTFIHSKNKSLNACNNGIIKLNNKKRYFHIGRIGCKFENKYFDEKLKKNNKSQVNSNNLNIEDSKLDNEENNNLNIEDSKLNNEENNNLNIKDNSKLDNGENNNLNIKNNSKLDNEENNNLNIKDNSKLDNEENNNLNIKDSKLDNEENNIAIGSSILEISNKLNNKTLQIIFNKNNCKIFNKESEENDINYCSKLNIILKKFANLTDKQKLNHFKKLYLDYNEIHNYFNEDDFKEETDKNVLNYYKKSTKTLQDDDDDIEIYNNVNSEYDFEEKIYKDCNYKNLDSFLVLQNLANEISKKYNHTKNSQVPNNNNFEHLKLTAIKEYQKIKVESKNFEYSNKENKIKDANESNDLNKDQIRSFNDFSESIFHYDSKRKMFKCPNINCNKEFPNLSRCKRHYIIHTAMKPFKCLNKKCNKQFSRRDNMLQHSRVHCAYIKHKKI